MSTTTDYDIGDSAYLTGTFRKTSDQSLQDPSVVTLTIKSPDKSLTVLTYGVSPAIVRESQGLYSTYFPLTQEGTYWYNFTGSGTVGAAGEKSFYCNPKKVS